MNPLLLHDIATQIIMFLKPRDFRIARISCKVWKTVADKLLRAGYSRKFVYFMRPENEEWIKNNTAQGTYIIASSSEIDIRNTTECESCYRGIRARCYISDIKENKRRIVKLVKHNNCGLMTCVGPSTFAICVYCGINFYQDS